MDDQSEHMPLVSQGDGMEVGLLCHCHPWLHGPHYHPVAYGAADEDPDRGGES